RIGKISAPPPVAAVRNDVVVAQAHQVHSVRRAGAWRIVNNCVLEQWLITAPIRIIGECYELDIVGDLDHMIDCRRQVLAPVNYIEEGVVEVVTPPDLDGAIGPAFQRPPEFQCMRRCDPLEVYVSLDAVRIWRKEPDGLKISGENGITRHGKEFVA